MHCLILGRAYGLVPGKEEAELLVAVKTLKEGSSTEVKEDFTLGIFGRFLNHPYIFGFSSIRPHGRMGKN